MITEAMPPGNTPLGLLYNLLTFVVGTLFSLNQIPQSVMVKISFLGASEVVFYGALGGIASLAAKMLCEYCITRVSNTWKKNRG